MDTSIPDTSPRQPVSKRGNPPSPAGFSPAALANVPFGFGINVGGRTWQVDVKNRFSWASRKTKCKGKRILGF